METVKSFIGLLNELADYKYLGAVILVIGVTLILTQITVLIISVAIKNQTGISSVRYFSKCLLLISVILSLIENVNTGYIFKSIKEVILYNGCLIAFSFLMLSALSVTSDVKKMKRTKSQTPENSREKPTVSVENVTAKTETVTEELKPTPSIVKDVIRLKCASFENTGTEFDGYLDISYLKSLLALLKEKNLTEQDSYEIEEFEVYLMNFASRHPHAFERQKLSGYLSELMKKLARYNAV